MQAVCTGHPWADYPRLMWPLGFSRADALAWAIALATGVIATALAWAGGARLGAALTLGVGLMVVVIVVALLIDARGRSFRDGA